MRVLALAALLGATLTTLAGSASGATDSFRRVAVARGFDAPVLVTHAPGEPRLLYVVEQPGRVIRLEPSGRRTAFLSIPGEVQYGGEQGLLGLAFHPRYWTNRLLYVAYTSRAGENVVAEYRSNGRTAISSTRRILLSVRDPYGNHNGGHLAFGPDGMLYTSIGDGGAGGDPEDRAQDMGSLFGKLLRLDAARRGADWQIAGLGLRNPWRFSFDRATGDLYIGDVGQNAIEEIDFTPRSRRGLQNYGWDLFEGSSRFEDSERGPGRLVGPAHQYRHAGVHCSVTGGYVYRGRARRSERGRYVFGDYCSGRVWSLRIRGGRARDVRTEPFTVSRLSSFGENAAGELYAVSHEGVVYRIS